MRSAAVAVRMTAQSRNGSARTRSEVAVYLCEYKPAVLGVVLRNAVVVATANSQLQELEGRVFPHQAPAVLIVMANVAIRIEIFGGDLEVMSLGDRPVGFEQADHLLAPRGEVLVGDVVRFREPRDRPGTQAGEDVLHLPAFAGGVVEVGARPDAPRGLHVLGTQAVLLAVRRG